jgi:hypothetical protein
LRQCPLVFWCKPNADGCGTGDLGAQGDGQIAWQHGLENEAEGGKN